MAEGQNTEEAIQSFESHSSALAVTNCKEFYYKFHRILVIENSISMWLIWNNLILEIGSEKCCERFWLTWCPVETKRVHGVSHSTPNTWAAN